MLTRGFVVFRHIKKSKVTRHCWYCLRSMPPGTEMIRSFGMSGKADDPGMVFEHMSCHKLAKMGYTPEDLEASSPYA